MIILIRHATPLVNYGKCNYITAKERLIHYNTTTDIKREEINIFLKSDFFKKKSLFKKKYIGLVSSLPRANETGKTIFNHYNYEYKISNLFREFELSLIKIPCFKLKLKTWFLVSRILWFLGINNGVESFRKSKSRVNKIVLLLNEHHENSNSPILVAHGLLNKFIEKKIIKDSWKIVFKQKTGCFEYTIYDKE